MERIIRRIMGHPDFNRKKQSRIHPGVMELHLDEKTNKLTLQGHIMLAESHELGSKYGTYKDAATANKARLKVRKMLREIAGDTATVQVPPRNGDRTGMFKFTITQKLKGPVAAQLKTAALKREGLIDSTAYRVNITGKPLKQKGPAFLMVDAKE